MLLVMYFVIYVFVYVVPSPFVGFMFVRPLFRSLCVYSFLYLFRLGWFLYFYSFCF